MKKAQQRLESELASGTEPQLEDVKKPEAVEVYESPRVPKRDEPLGTEDGPKNAPKSFPPPVPDPSDQGLAARSSDKHARSPVRAKSEPKTPRKTEETPSKRSEGNLPMQTPQVADEPSKSLAVAVTDASAVKSEANMQGASNGPQSAGNVSERAQRVVPSSTASMSQVVISPTQPLFDEQQLRQFQEMFNQAPWLYPGAQPLMMPQLTMPPQIARPLFLEQDERRVQGSLQVGEALQFVFPYGQKEGQNPRLQEIPFQSRLDLEMLMEENKKLRERVLALESQKEEEFSTPNGEQKGAETTIKEAVRPPKTEAEETRNFRSKEAETTNEAAGPKGPTMTELLALPRSLWNSCPS